MPETNNEITFRSDNIFAGQTGIIDYENAIIKGVSLITGGIEAEGHNLLVDDKTISELNQCAQKRGKIPVQLDHGSGISGTCGYLTDFRVDGNKLRGDLHLLRSHDETDKIMERAEKMPDCFGLSVAFKGPPKGVPVGGGKMAARCEKLLSVDLVTRPAANEGLFSVPAVDKSLKGMAQENPGQQQGNAYTTLEDVVRQLAAVSERLNQQDQFNNQLIEHLNSQAQAQQGPGELTLADLYEMSDEQLAQLNLTRDEVNAAVEEALAEAEAQGQIANEGQPQGQQLEPAGAGAGTGAQGGSSVVDGSPAGAGATAMGSLEKRLIRLEQREKILEMRKKRDAEEHELSEIERKAVTLAKQRNEAIELAEKFKAENDALRVAVRTGTRPVMAGVDNGLRMFSADDNGQLHEFQVRVKHFMEVEKKTEGEAIRMAQKENPGLHAEWLESLQKKRIVTA